MRFLLVNQRNRKKKEQKSGKKNNHIILKQIEIKETRIKRVSPQDP